MKEEFQPVVRNVASRRNIILSALSSMLYIVALGMVYTYSAPATVDMQKKGSRFSDVTPEEITWIASLPSLSAVVGNALSGYASHRLGRKAILMYVSLSYAVSWLVIAYAPNMGFVFAGRFASGFFAGICSVAVPAYVVEVSSVEIRGFLSAGFQVAFSLGVLLTMSLGIELRWSWLAVAGAVCVSCGALLMTFMPESPPWLLRMSRNDEAFNSLVFLRGKHRDAVEEFQKMADHLAEEPKQGLTIEELFCPSLYKPMLIAIALMFFQQFVGINALMSYSVEIFQNSSKYIDPSVAATIVAVVQLLVTLFSSLLVDKVGRRPLYIISGTFVALSLSASGAYTFHMNGGADVTSWSWVPLVTFVTYMIAFSVGLGPIPLVVTPEMVPTHSRSFLLAVACVSTSFFSFVVTKTFNNLRSMFGLAVLYWAYATFAIVAVIFYSIFVPETKGRTIRDIHRSFAVHQEF